MPIVRTVVDRLEVMPAGTSAVTFKAQGALRPPEGHPITYRKGEGPLTYEICARIIANRLLMGRNIAWRRDHEKAVVVRYLLST